MRPNRLAFFLPLVLLGSVRATVPQPADLQPDPATQPAPSVSPATGSGLRGLWVDGFGPGLRSPAEVSQMVETAASMGFNALFVQAVRRGDCLCQRSSVPVGADVQKGFDPLAEVIRQAHARKLRVIGWVSVTGAWNAKLPAAGAMQVFAQHGPGVDGRTARESWLSRRPDSSWRSNDDGWLDPGIPAAADHMVASAVSLVRNYDLDGLQLDRIRYPDGGNWGYSPITLGRYRQETGAAGLPAPTDERWRAWKREQVTALTRRIVLEARALKPGVIVSAATIVYGDGPADLNAFRATRTYSEVLQDWPAWMKEGLLDLNVTMNYKRGGATAADGASIQDAWYDHWNAFLLAQRSGTEEAAAGTSMYLNTPAVTASQAGRALNLGLGWVGYSYRTPTLDVYKASQSQPQGMAAIRAALPGVLDTQAGWRMTVQARRAILGRVTGLAQPGGLNVSVYGPDGVVLSTGKTDGNGFYGFTDLPAGTMQVRVGDQSWAEPLSLGVTRFPNLLLRALVRSKG